MPVTQAVQEMLDHRDRGFLSLIKYDKGPTQAIHDRLVEPRTMIGGVRGTLLRTYQIEPEEGYRSFKTAKIFDVRCSERPIAAVILAKAEGGPEPSHDFIPLPSITIKLSPPRTRRRKRLSATDAWFADYAVFVGDALVDLKVDDAEVQRLAALRDEMGLTAEQVDAVCSRLFAELLLEFSSDGRIEAGEREQIRRYADGLRRIGWSNA